jgi:EmrB/QacA subfamily drug resistance transporter
MATNEISGRTGQDTLSDRATHRPLVMLLICAAQFVLTLDFSIVNVALPTIQREFGMPAVELQWMVTGYALTFGSLLLAGGRLADLFGRRRLMLSGLVLFGLASLACGLAQWPVMLIVGRVIQGAGGAMVSPAALSLLTIANPDGPARQRALAIWGAISAGGATAGILAGGLLTQFLGWRAVFLVNPPLIAIMLTFSGRLPANRPAGGQRVDVRGAILSSVTIAALIFGLSNGQQHGFGSPGTIITLAAAVVLAAGFVLTERTVKAPMLPLSIISNRTRRAALVAMMMIGAVLSGYVYFISLFLQKTEGFSPLETGGALAPSTLTVMLTATLLTRRLLTRFTAKHILLTGLVFITAGQLWVSQITATADYGTAVLPGALLTAFGIGLSLPTVAIAITTGVQGKDQGLAGALLTTGQQVGGAIGLAILATAAAARTAHAGGALVDGYRLSFLIGAGLMVLAFVLVSTLLSSGACQQEFARQRTSTGNDAPHLPAAAQLRRA